MFNWIELVGYVASALVVVSLAMTSVVKLRMISFAGSIIFVAYGVLIGSIPIIITNSAVALINVWHLIREFSPQQDLGGVPIAADAPFLLDFLHSHAGDIHRIEPGFTAPALDAFALVLTRQGMPAGVVVGRQQGEDLRLDLDYVLQAYRDSRVGGWLYGRGTSLFTEAGIRRIVANPGSPGHRAYLKQMGFEAGRDQELVLTL